MSRRDLQIGAALGAALAHRSPSYVHETRTVVEQRAPTDESVRLLKEMQQAAEAKLIDSVHVGNTVLECVAQCWTDNLSDKMVLRAVFKLNGKQMSATHSVPMRDWGGAQIAAWNGLRDEVAKVIAAEAIMDAFQAMRRTS